MNVKETLGTVWLLLKKFDESQDKTIRLIRLEFYFVALLAMGSMLMLWFVEIWLAFSFLPASWLYDIRHSLSTHVITRSITEIISDITNLRIGEAEVFFINILQLGWTAICFIGTTIIGFKIKGILRERITKTLETKEIKS